MNEFIDRIGPEHRRATVPRPLMLFCAARQRLSLAVLTLALCLSGSAWAEVRIQIHNFVTRTAAGDAEVRIQLNNAAPVTLDYKAASPFVSVPGPEVRARLSDRQGKVLVDETFPLLDGRDYVLAAAGNGENEAYVLNPALLSDLTLPLPSSAFSSRFLAPIGSRTDLIQARFLSLECTQPAPPLDTSLLAIRQVSDFASLGSNVTTFLARPCNSVHLAVASTGGQQRELRKEFETAAGQRLFVFAIGGDQYQPFELHIVNTGVTKTYTNVPITKAMEGMWYDPLRGGEGFVFLVDSSRPEPQRLRIMLYGYEKGKGDSRWAASYGGSGNVHFFENLSGGSPNGAVPAARLMIGSAQLRFSSCREALIDSVSIGDVLQAKPEDMMRTRRLVKLVPSEDCGSN